jgi:hypothetical protein
MAPLLCASPLPVVARRWPSAAEKTCIMMIRPSMPMTMATITSTRVKPRRRTVAVGGRVEGDFMAFMDFWRFARR